MAGRPPRRQVRAQTSVRPSAQFPASHLADLNNFAAPSSYLDGDSPVDRKQVVSGLLMKARKYRNFAMWIGDWETAQQILALAEELKQRARSLARPNERRIRKRAHQIWEENGRPSGRDKEFWFQAEREFREAENLAKESEDV